MSLQHVHAHAGIDCFGDQQVGPALHAGYTPGQLPLAPLWHIAHGSSPHPISMRMHFQVSNLLGSTA